MKSRIVMVIHDALYVKAPVNEEEQARRWMKTVMEHAAEMPIVHLEVDMN